MAPPPVAGVAAEEEPLEDHLGDLLAVPPARPSVVDASRRETVQLEDDLGSMLAAVGEEAPMPPPAPRPSEIDASRRETVQLEDDLGSMLAAVETRRTAGTAPVRSRLAPRDRAIGGGPRLDARGGGRGAAGRRRRPKRPLRRSWKKLDALPVPGRAAGTFVAEEEKPRRRRLPPADDRDGRRAHDRRARADGRRAHGRAGVSRPRHRRPPSAMPPPAPVARSAAPSKKRKSLEALGSGHVAELRKRHLANVAEDAERHRQREAAKARAVEAAADVGGLVGLFEGAVEKHQAR